MPYIKRKDTQTKNWILRVVTNQRRNFKRPGSRPKTLKISQLAEARQINIMEIKQRRQQLQKNVNRAIVARKKWHALHAFHALHPLS